MVLELHIWGPAFGLPSIDAECLATVVYLIHCLSPSDWQLIPSSNTSISPPDELPALKSGSAWVSGYSAIIDHLRETSAGQWDLDRELDKQQRADTVAFSSFLQSRGQPLLDLSLFVSSENYTKWTRPALAQILQWPNQWVIPHRLRDEAKIRSEHLGLSSLDIDTATGSGNEVGSDTTRGAGNIPKSLLTNPKDTVASALSKTGRHHQFRLDALCSAFFSPLSDLLQIHGPQSWIFETDHPTSLDCLLLAYLSLMAPPLHPPHTFLHSALSANHSALVQWTRSFRQKSFGGPILASDVLALSSSESPPLSNKLPWSPVPRSSKTRLGLTLLNATFDSLPIVSWYRSDRVIRTSSPSSSRAGGGDGVMVPTYLQASYTGLGVMGLALVSLLLRRLYVGFWMRPGGGGTLPAGYVHIFMPGGSVGTSRRDFGQAGRILGL